MLLLSLSLTLYHVCGLYIFSQWHIYVDCKTFKYFNSKLNIVVMKWWLLSDKWDGNGFAKCSMLHSYASLLLWILYLQLSSVLLIIWKLWRWTGLAYQGYFLLLKTPIPNFNNYILLKRMILMLSKQNLFGICVVFHFFLYY